jgi:CRISPR/Cas system-associated endoribonuclease Cas2
MSFFLIAYDLRNPCINYRPFYADMMAMGAKRLQQSLWGVNTADEAANICDRLWKKLDAKKDRLLVAPMDRSQPYKSENTITCIQNL